MSELFIIRARNPRPGDAPAICYRFTEDGAAAEIERLRTAGREAYAERGAVRCGWGAAYTDTHCRNDATMVEVGDFHTSYMCDEHAAWCARDHGARFHDFPECAEIEKRMEIQSAIRSEQIPLI